MVLDPGTRLMEADDINRSTATGTPLVITPRSGDAVALSFPQRVVYVNPMSLIAALTIKMPSMVNAGGLVVIGFGQAVTALTVQDATGALVQNTSGVIGQGIEFRYLGSGNWVRWR